MTQRLPKPWRPMEKGCHLVAQVGTIVPPRFRFSVTESSQFIAQSSSFARERAILCKTCERSKSNLSIAGTHVVDYHCKNGSSFPVYIPGTNCSLTGITGPWSSLGWSSLGHSLGHTLWDFKDIPIDFHLDKACVPLDSPWIPPGFVILGKSWKIIP